MRFRITSVLADQATALMLSVDSHNFESNRCHICHIWVSSLRSSYRIFVRLETQQINLRQLKNLQLADNPLGPRGLRQGTDGSQLWNKG